MPGALEGVPEAYRILVLLRETYFLRLPERLLGLQVEPVGTGHTSVDLFEGAAPSLQGEHRSMSDIIRHLRDPLDLGDKVIALPVGHVIDGVYEPLLRIFRRRFRAMHCNLQPAEVLLQVGGAGETNKALD